MTYNPSIPQSTDLISVSQGQILTNFGQLNTQFGVDHNAFSTASVNGNGHHKQISFDVARAAPSLSGTQSMFYPKTVSAVVEPYFANATKDGAIWYGGTGSGEVAAASGASQSSGSLTLPSGHILKWGYIGSTITDNVQINFPVAFPNACFTVTCTGMLSGASSRVLWIVPGSISTAGFTPRTDSSSMQLTYWAIGW